MKKSTDELEKSKTEIEIYKRKIKELNDSAAKNKRLEEQSAASKIKMEYLEAQKVEAERKMENMKKIMSNQIIEVKESQVETEEKVIQTVEMIHFENFSTMVLLSEGQSTFLSTLIAKMAETGLEDLVEWKKP